MPLIVLEGLDGAGKSTQITNLINRLSASGLECETLHFPRFDAPVYGDLIARFLRGELGALDQVNPYLVALLFAGDRGDAGKKLRESLAAGKYVILDRYVYSNIGFQCAKLPENQRDALREWILDVEFNHFGIPRPDVSLFLDVPFAFTERKLTQNRKGDDRSYLQGERDIHEDSLDLQQRVRSVYLKCAEHDSGLVVIDCSDGGALMARPEDIFKKIEQALAGFIL